jgi:hypothetical protein
MKRRTRAVLLMGSLALVLGWFGAGVTESPPPKPLPPSDMVPPIDARTTTAVCVGCGEPFDFPGHEMVMKDLLRSAYVARLRHAMYVQDIFHQFESKAHFDNCDFDGAIGYLVTLWAETGDYVGVAQQALDATARDAAILDAFFRLGQALHAIQDFYAHTDYVERQVPAARKPTDIPVIRPWRAAERGRLDALRAQGLISGFVYWGFPWRCVTRKPAHGDIAKDSAATRSGRIKVPHLQNLSRHELAVFLAREASKDYLEDAFKQWPLLRQANGPHVGFDMLVDRRGL